jgi:hypothetical protein
MSYLNFCRSCETDFASDEGFDSHAAAMTTYSKRVFSGPHLVGTAVAARLRRRCSRLGWKSTQATVGGSLGRPFGKCPRSCGRVLSALRGFKRDQ